MFDPINVVLIKFCTFCNLDCAYCIIDDHDSKDNYQLFDQYKELKELLLTMNIGPHLEFEITGGECTLYCDEIRKFVKEMKKVERYRDTKVSASITTNGSNLDGAFGLIKDGVIDPWSMKMSWDGIYSASKVRFSKLEKYDDQFFKDQVAKLGSSPYNKDILLRIAITHESVDDLYESFKYALDHGCNKLEYYKLYLKDDPYYYHDKGLLSKLKAQLEKIADLYKERPFNYENWNYLYFTKYLKGSNPVDMGCPIIGKMLYVNTAGELYPCVLFSDNCGFEQDFKIGDLKDKLYPEVMKEFEKAYNGYDKRCKSCNQYHCSKCPAMLYYTRDMGEQCYVNPLKRLEKEVFDSLAPELNQDQIHTLAKRFSYLTEKTQFEYML